jgi:hypothetical protein
MTSARSVALLAALVAFAGAAAAQSPALKDFAYGLFIESEVGRPALQFTLPDAVYQGVTRADLGDLRVFNAGGVVVPHALCAGAEVGAEIVSERPLPVFPLRRPAPLGSQAGGRVTLQTPGGTSVQVVEGHAASAAITPTAPAPADGFVVDAGNAPGALRTLRLSWSTPDGASEAQVRVEASEDLNAWRTVVAGTTLLHIAADGQALDRNHIDLPEARYRYLRLVRNAGPAVAISGVSADVVTPGAASAPRWFAAMPAADAEDGAFLFDASRLAPVEAARIDLAVANMALGIALDSRAAPGQEWRTRWTGDVSSVGGSEAAAPAFGAVTDTLWRVRVLRGAESLGGGRPVLRLGYHPARLRFLAQGDGPFVVAYGSARVPPAQAAGCDTLLPRMPEQARATLIGAAVATPAADGPFGGPEVLAPPDAPTPVRQIVLWIVLLLGTGALVAMALALLRRLREGGAAP